MAFDGVKTDEQRRLCEKLEASSRGRAAGTFGADGQLEALVGEFEVPDASPAKAAAAFLERWPELFGRHTKLVLRESRVEKSRLVRGAVAVPFDFQERGTPSFDAGVQVLVRRNVIVGVYARAAFATRPRRPRRLDPAAAIAAIERQFPREDHRQPKLPQPVEVLVDPWAMFGRPGKPGVWFQFSVEGESGPCTVLVSPDGTQVVPVGMRPEGLPPYSPVPSYHLHPVTKVPDFVSFAPTGLLLPEAASGDPETAARALFTRYPTLWGTGDQAQQLELVEVVTGSGPAAAMKTVVFRQRFVGIPVEGCGLRVHLTPALAVRCVTGAYYRDPGIAADPKVPAQVALSTAIATYMAEGGVEGPGFPQLPDVAMCIVPTSFTRNFATGDHVAWKLRFPDRDLFVSAHSGSVVLRVPRHDTAALVYDSNNAARPSTGGPAGSVLQLRDGVVEPGAGTPDPEAQPAADALATILGFFQNLFGRASWDGRNSDVHAYVDVNFPNNADSLNGTLRFGRGRVINDWIAHEFTHSIVDATCDLVGLDESGAINEGMADIFGELIFPQTPATTWVFGDTLATPTRNLLNPGAIVAAGFTPPARYSNWIATLTDGGGVHLNCGIVTRANVLLCDGDGSAAHTGIDRGRLAVLDYFTLTRLLHPWATFVDLLHASWDAARMLTAMGEQGVLAPSAPNPANAFDLAVADEVLWAYRQVDLDLLLTQGFFHVRGNFSTVVTFYQGLTLPTGQTINDVVVKARRFTGNALMFEGLIRATGATSVTDTGSGNTITMTAPPAIGSANPETAVTVTSPSAIDVELQPNLLVNVAPPPHGTPPAPPIRFEETGAVVHWCDFPFCGRRYRDVIYPSQSLPAGSKVIDVELDLLDHHYLRIGTHRLGNPAPDGGGFGAWIAGRTVGGAGLLVVVDSYHDAFKSVRYLVRYTIEGAGSALPEMERLGTLR